VIVAETHEEDQQIKDRQEETSASADIPCQPESHMNRTMEAEECYDAATANGAALLNAR
jgi:hypothetical protein